MLGISTSFTFAQLVNRAQSDARD